MYHQGYVDEAIEYFESALVPEDPTDMAHVYLSLLLGTWPMSSLYQVISKRIEKYHKCVILYYRTANKRRE